jgi:hypothetical protein
MSKYDGNYVLRYSTIGSKSLVNESLRLYGFRQGERKDGLRQETISCSRGATSMREKHAYIAYESKSFLAKQGYLLRHEAICIKLGITILEVVFSFLFSLFLEFGYVQKQLVE